MIKISKSESYHEYFLKCKSLDEKAQSYLLLFSLINQKV